MEWEVPDVEQLGVGVPVSAVAALVAGGEEWDGGVAFHVEEGLVLEGDFHGWGGGSDDVQFGLGLGG